VDYRARRAMPTALARFAGDAGLPLVDTTPAFVAHGAAKLFLATDYHAGPGGHAVVAREVARWLGRAHPCGLR